MHGPLVSLPRPTLLLPVVIVGTLFVLLNVASLVNILPQLQYGGRAGDWAGWGQVNIDDPYSWEWVRWSPPAVWVQATVQPWAYPVVFVGNLLALLLLPWRAAVVMLLFWPFWGSQLHGSFLPVIVVAGWNALEGRRWGVMAFVACAVLIPRPLMLPVLAVLLWRHPLARWTFLAAVVFVVGYSLTVGQLDDWLLRMTDVGSGVGEHDFNVSPSALIGAWWVPIGLVLGAFLTWKGWYGLASVAVSPYLLTYYLVVLVWDVRRVISPSPSADTVSVTPRPASPGN